MIEAKFVERIAEEVGARPEQVAAAIPLFDKGATVPFIARYRKDVTGNLSEEKLERVEDRNNYFTALTNRRQAALENIEKQDKLTDDLRTRLDGVYDHTTLEDLYLPFKRQRRTKASMARDQGLEALADFIWAQDLAGPPMHEKAMEFMSPEKSVSSPEEALLGAQHILAERVATDPVARSLLRNRMLQEGVVTSRATKNAEEDPAKFKDYFDFNEPLRKVPSYRLLAILRGARVGMLRMEVVIDDDTSIDELVAHYAKEAGSPFENAVRVVVEDAYKRLLRPAIEKEVIGIAREKADDEAIHVFRANAENLLLSPPAGAMPVLGIDPGGKSGCKLAAVNAEGGYLESALVRIDDPEPGLEEATKTVAELLDKHGIEAIAIGNGAGSREVGRFIDKILEKRDSQSGFTIFVSEAGTSVYAASKLAREEFPDLDPAVRGAISIARRLQDPLAELVKVEPRSVGVGQYQHDVNQRRLREALTRTVEYTVNRVGVQLNTASVELLRYVSGMQMGTAQNIAEYRKEHGPFTSREQIKEVSGIGEKTYEQCAGFLRIREAENPLDATAIHPEAYGVAEAVAAKLETSVANLLASPDLVRRVDFAEFADGAIGKHTLNDIRGELMRPGRDPRSKFRVPRFIKGVHEVADLKEDMESEGVVTNVTDFGAFVDIGVHQDGLIHLSELSNRYVRDPREIVRVGEIVRVKVIKIDKDANRISLSRKALLAPPKRARAQYPDRSEGSGRAPRESQGPQRGAEAPRQDRRPAARREPGREDRRGERSRDAARPGRSGDRPRGPKRPRRDAPRRQGPAHQSQQSGEGLNTLLADQLAALRDKFNDKSS